MVLYNPATKTPPIEHLYTVEMSIMPNPQLIEAIGGKETAKSYLQSLDPGENAIRAGVPVYAYFPDLDQTALGRFVSYPVDRGFARTTQKISPQSEVIAASQLARELGFRDPQQIIPWRVKARNAEKIVSFLRKIGVE